MNTSTSTATIPDPSSDPTVLVLSNDLIYPVSSVGVGSTPVDENPQSSENWTALDAGTAIEAGPGCRSWKLEAIGVEGASIRDCGSTVSVFVNEENVASLARPQGTTMNLVAFSSAPGPRPQLALRALPVEQTGDEIPSYGVFDMHGGSSTEISLACENGALPVPLSPVVLADSGAWPYSCDSTLCVARWSVAGLADSEPVSEVATSCHPDVRSYGGRLNAEICGQFLLVASQGYIDSEEQLGKYGSGVVLLDLSNDQVVWAFDDPLTSGPVEAAWFSENDCE